MAICLPARYNDRIICCSEQLWLSIVDWTQIIGPIEERLIGFQFEWDCDDSAMFRGKYNYLAGGVPISKSVL